jgi:hypothetical protein
VPCLNLISPALASFFFFFFFFKRPNINSVCGSCQLLFPGHGNTVSSTSCKSFATSLALWHDCPCCTDTCVFPNRSLCEANNTLKDFYIYWPCLTLPSANYICLVPFMTWLSKPLLLWGFFTVTLCLDETPLLVSLGHTGYFFQCLQIWIHHWKQLRNVWMLEVTLQCPTEIQYSLFARLSLIIQNLLWVIMD